MNIGTVYRHLVDILIRIRFNWFDQFFIKTRISFGDLILKNYVWYLKDTHEIYFSPANYFPGSGLHFEIEYPKVMLYILKIKIIYRKI